MSDLDPVRDACAITTSVLAGDDAQTLLVDLAASQAEPVGWALAVVAASTEMVAGFILDSVGGNRAAALEAWAAQLASQGIDSSAPWARKARAEGGEA
ncbi:hypothetical protein [Sinomonas sp. P47F7]|uniref:hypothetical protein n=1 Tax=Sinomonas sp. P47F7 TaxID=3410987 RepID=UPI003BF61669